MAPRDAARRCGRSQERAETKRGRRRRLGFAVSRWSGWWPPAGMPALALRQRLCEEIPQKEKKATMRKKKRGISTNNTA
jgi:hypothetical protein